MKDFNIGFTSHAVLRCADRGLNTRKVEDAIRKAGQHIYNLHDSKNVVIVADKIVVVCAFEAWNGRSKFVVVTAIADDVTHLTNISHLFVV